jgi:hypothetical protein
VQVIFPRSVGLLVGVFVVFLVRTPGSTWVIWALAAAWLVPAVMLVRGGPIRPAAAALAALSVTGFVDRFASEYLALPGAGLLGSRSYDEVFLWIAIILYVTEGRPHERAFLVRVMLSVVYGFAAVVKLNPAWLAGDQLVRLAYLSPVLGPVTDLIASPVGRLIAVAVILTEGWLAIGLWFRRTRAGTALLGVAMHTGIVVTATLDLDMFFELVALNFSLVAMYVAFWFPITGSVSHRHGRHDADELEIEPVLDRQLAWVHTLAAR